jgi:hypothetical protein
MTTSFPIILNHIDVFILFIEADVFVQHSYECVHLVLEQRKKSVKKE